MTSVASIRQWSLRRRLVVGTMALVFVSLLFAATATVLSLRASLYERLDDDVRAGLKIAGGPGGDGSGMFGEQTPKPDDSQTELDAETGSNVDGEWPGSGPRQRVNSLQVIIESSGQASRASYVGPNGTTVSLNSNQLEVIKDAVEESNAPVTVALGGSLGDFRVVADSRADGRTVVSGLSMRDTSATVTSLGWILAVVLGVTALLAAAGIAWLVTVTLRPLHRVADTAERVAQRPLAAGAVTLPERADLADDPSTEVGRVGAAFDTMLSHVEGALAARQESEDRLRAFIADASHELRTPLASIRGYAQLAQGEGAEMTPVQARSLDRIESEAERMGALVEDLLLLARLDAGQPLRQEPVDVSLIAIETVDDAHAAHPDHEWQVEVEESIEITADAQRLRQVFINLLGNAASHTPPGTTVTASVRQVADGVRITVRDNGPGIEPELLPRLFDRFTRGDVARNRAAGSTGLGLSIAAAIVHAHRGVVSVANGSPGAIFTVELPSHPAVSVDPAP